ncbi:MAG: insulinase family protein [Oscillospiraceae bacterium]|nr:insulinase family protein [Oscillospiraceae bacterium]
MSQVIQAQLFPGVNLTAVHTNKFKSSYFGVSLLTALDRDRAAENALVPWVLRRGCRTYPDLQAISTRLDELYGGALEVTIEKKGESQCLCLNASFLDDAFTPGEEQLLEPAVSLLGDILLHPYTENGVFSKEYVAGEQTNLIDTIRAQVNDKRRYSMLRLGQEMCRREAFGISKLGDEESAAAITADSLWRRYQALLSTAQVELFYCGSAAPERVQQAFKTAFAKLPVNPDREQSECELRITAPAEPNVVEEALDVTQGKLAMGFRTDGIGVWDEEYPALMLLNAVFGGTSMSKLFMNVREKLSLCYFASSALEKFKGLMMVSSGIEFEKFRQAKDEILAQLDACRRGEISDEELDGARRILSTALHTLTDSQRRLADYWLGQAVAGIDETPEQLAQRLEQVSKEQIVQVAGRMHLDTIFFLKGKEAQQ